MTLTDNALKAAVQVIENHKPRWIPVSERLPERLEWVLVHGGIAYYLDKEQQWMTITGERYPGKPIQWDVTHWMPLPEPPE